MHHFVTFINLFDELTYKKIIYSLYGNQNFSIFFNINKMQQINYIYKNILFDHVFFHQFINLMSLYYGKIPELVLESIEIDSKNNFIQIDINYEYSSESINVEYHSKEIQDNSSNCIICMENTFTHIGQVCGHYCVCNNCSINLKECPLCRVQTKFIKVFKPF